MLMDVQMEMDFDSIKPQKYWTVSSITRHLKDWIENNIWLQDCWVRGEISNLSRPSSGHIYFSLKDSGAQMRCVIWRTQATRLRLNLFDGQQVEVHGAVTIYEAAGQYQLIADDISIAGEGDLYLEFLRLKAKLEAEGLFSPVRKRSLPDIPARIGIVTSPTGAAVQDILNTIKRRYPLAEVVLSPAMVQGVDAPSSILHALRSLTSMKQPVDLIILARGGGSMEDLWCFNDEEVVRAIAASPVPIVTGIGHETDYTLADFAADLRAPTPTAAAEISTPHQDDLRGYTAGLLLRCLKSLQESYQQSRQQLSMQKLILEKHSPASRLTTGRLQVDHLMHRMTVSFQHQLAAHKSMIASLMARLNSVNPLAVLERGYAMVINPEDGQIVRSIHQVQADDKLNVRVQDGSFPVVVQSNNG